MPSLGDMVVRLQADTRQFRREMTASERAIGSVARMARTAANAIAGYFTYRAGRAIVKLAADAEMLQRQFTVLTGSETSGKALFGDVEKFAMRTALTLDETANAVTKLLATGVAQSDLMSTLQLLGDLSMGDANRLGFLSKAYTDVLAKQRLMGQEIRQFSENGVPLIKALAEQYGVTAQEILKMSEAGEISFTDMEKALRSLTEDGGQFANMLESMADTTSGKFEIMKEQLRSIGRAIGESVLPPINDILSAVKELMETFGDAGVGDFVKTMRLGAMDMSKDMLKAKNFLEAAATFFNPMSTVQEKVDAIEKARRNNAALDPFFAKRANEIRGEDRTEQIGNWRAMQIEFHELGRQMAGGISMGWQQGVRNPDAQELAMLYDNAMSMTAMFNAFTTNPSAGKALKNAMLTDAGGAFQGGLGLGFASPLFAMATNPAFLSGATDQLQFAGAAEKGSSSAFDTILAAMRGSTKSAEAQGIDKLNMTVKKEVGEPLKKLADADAGFIVVEDLNA